MHVLQVDAKGCPERAATGCDGLIWTCACLATGVRIVVRVRKHHHATLPNYHHVPHLLEDQRE